MMVFIITTCMTINLPLCLNVGIQWMQKKRLVLKPNIISCDFEKGAIKAFKLAFPGVKIQGCHFHFTSAIHKKIVDLGLKTIYSGENHNEDFTVWVRMLMAFPFLMMNDIDEVWDEMIDSKPILDADDESKVTFILCFK